ncbi:MAG: ATP-binding protein [Nitrospirota bacterium]|nr:ATP-binding protein [Nitrospirota bacterium]
MASRVKFSIRLKLLLMMLVVVTAVVSTITFNIVTLFQKDKTTYLFDLTSVTALHLAEEANTTLLNYDERLGVFAQSLLSEEISESGKEAYVKKLLASFEGFIAISLYNVQGEKEVTLLDESVFGAADLRREDLSAYRLENPIPFEDLKPETPFLQHSTFIQTLPSFTLIRRVHDKNFDETFFVVAEIQLNKLLGLSGKSKVFETFLVDDAGTIISSSKTGSQGNDKDFHEDVSNIPVVAAFIKGQALAETLEYAIDGIDYLGAYARIEYGGFGAVAQIPKSVAYLAAKELIDTLLRVSLGVLAFSVLVVFVWSRGMTRPIQKLSEATRRVASGHFDIEVSTKSKDEIGLLATSFNRMASELQTRETDLKSAQAALVQSEKMAAFGQLGAGIAHEVKNPLAGILGYAQLALRKADKESLLAKQLRIIEKETKRCKTIIENLMKFSRQEKTEKTPIQLNQVLEDAVVIVDHQLTINKVKIEKQISENLPTIAGNANQLQQVLMNLMINAQQAMPEGGTVSLKTWLDGDQVQVCVRDTGPGMPPEVQKKIFEPFFTTKPVGKGTGLGLSVSYGIVKDHYGEILLESKLGEGTTFTLSFPVMDLRLENKEEVRDG